MALRIRAAIAAIVLVAATGIGQWAFAGWEFTSAVQETAQGVRHASCSASLAIGSGGQVRIGNPVRYLGLHVGRATVDSRRAVGGEELKPRLTIVGFGPHHTRSRRSEFGPEARCWLERDATDGTYSTACELATTEHRITYQGIGGDSRRHEAWVLVGSIYGGMRRVDRGPHWSSALHYYGAQYAVWWDYPEEMFATDERQVVRINAGGNSRPDVNGFISPSELRFELWDARSMRAAVQRCAERHLEAGLLEWPTADADGDAELWTGPDGGLYDLGIYESGRIGRKPLD